MQILGKRSKILLIAVAIAMLAALGLSFALWDTQAVKASSGSLSTYANARVGDIIEFGQYYQTDEKDSVTGEYIKTPIEWIVVDKDERTGNLTLMSKYILASGSYFGNWYYNSDDIGGWHYNETISELNNKYVNQSYTDSTVRAYLNNLERLDLGGDSFDAVQGFMSGYKDSAAVTGLLRSVGYSNQRYWTELKYVSDAEKLLVDTKNNGFDKRLDSNAHNEIYYQRPIENDEYKNRPMARGFYDEAFNAEEKSLIAPKAISGFNGRRWPNNDRDASKIEYIEGSVDKVWLPSATELNIAEGEDWNKLGGDAWSVPGDASGSTVFEYCKNYRFYKNPFKAQDGNNASLAEAIYSRRTAIAANGKIGNYSIPVYKKGTSEPITDISESRNSTNDYWTRTPSSFWYDSIRTVNPTGYFYAWFQYQSHIGVRPCINLKY